MIFISTSHLRFHSVEGFSIRHNIENDIHYHLYIEDEGKVHDIPTDNINLDLPSIPACLNLHNIDVIVRVRSLKDNKKS